MTIDLSYINETPSEAQEDAVRLAVEQECIRAIVTYLEEVATTMDANGIQFIDSANLRAMADTLFIRIEANDENKSN